VFGYDRNFMDPARNRWWQGAVVDNSSGVIQLTHSAIWSESIVPGPDPILIF
jgi:hypothetical protein